MNSGRAWRGLLKANKPRRALPPLSAPSSRLVPEDLDRYHTTIDDSELWRVDRQTSVRQRLPRCRNIDSTAPLQFGESGAFYEPHDVTTANRAPHTTEARLSAQP